MRRIYIFSLIVLVAVISVFFVAGCGDDGITTFTTGVQGTTGATGATGDTGVTGATGTIGSVNLYSLTVNVADSVGPVIDAAVTLSHMGIPSSELVSSAPGDYTFTNLTEGKYRLYVEAPGCKPYSADIDIPYTGGTLSVTMDDGLLNMVLIPAGSFQMGHTGIYSDEEPVHDVTLTQDFYIDKYEVTNGEYVKFLNAQTVIRPNWVSIESNDYCGLTGEILNPSGIQVKTDYENRPVVYVSWYGAVAYCNWLSEEYGYTPGTGEGYRLPTEAEWEYSCRAGTTTEYFWTGWGTMDIDDYCWYGGNSEGNHHNVGLKLPNQFGLFDMSGNVAEWCNDWYGDTYYQYCVDNSIVNTPPGPMTGEYRVVRGGSWFASAAVHCSSHYRGAAEPDVCIIPSMGFRLVKD